MNELDKIINKGEKVLWQGVPQKAPFMASSIFFSLIVMFFLGMFAVPILLGVSVFAFFLSGVAGIIIFFLLGFGIIALFVFIIIYALAVHKRIVYAITDKRVIFQGGLIGRDFQMVDFDQISDAQVRVGIFDKVFGKNSGCIYVVSNGKSLRAFAYITNPYEVFKMLKITSHDVKTDIQYPNALRPKTNPGYKTKLKRK